MIEYMCGLDGRWRVFREIPMCPTCGHKPGLMVRVCPEDGFATQREAEEWWTRQK